MSNAVTMIFDSRWFAGGASFTRTYRMADADGLPIGPPMSHSINGTEVSQDDWERELAAWRAWSAQRA